MNKGIWFGVSLLLIGVIFGYGSSGALTGGRSGNTAQLVAPTPSAPAAPTPTPTPSAPAAPGVAPKTGVGPTLGSSSAKTTIVEFTDFQCPVCARHFNDTYGEVKKNYIDTGKVKYEIRMLPLNTIHPVAQITAEAAMCANKLGGAEKFFAMHDELFSSPNHDVWPTQRDPVITQTLVGYAKDIGLNEAAFTQCLTNHDTAGQITKDAADAAAAGAVGTPSFWIIGAKGNQFIGGAREYPGFSLAIDNSL